MNKLKCVRLPQQGRNLTLETEYDNCSYFDSDMRPIESFEDSHWVFVTNNRGNNVRYRKTLFIPVTVRQVEPEPTPSININTEYIVENIYMIKPEEGPVRVGIVEGCVTDIPGCGVSTHKWSPFSCGVVLLSGIEHSIELIKEFVENDIRGFITNSFEEEVLFNNINDNEIIEELVKLFIQELVNYFRSASAFMQISLTEDSLSYDILHENILEYSLDNINSIGFSNLRVNPNSDNYICILTFELIYD